MIMNPLLSVTPETDMGIVNTGLISGGVSFFVFTSHKKVVGVVK